MTDKQRIFIDTIGAIARNEFLNRKKWILPSVCIAQAILESGWNLNAKSLFGIKGKGFTATTSEYINGEWVRIQDAFREYPDITSSVVGYYDFITTTPRYSNCVCNYSYRDTVDKLIHTTDGCPYATAPNYISTIISLIEGYHLTDFDTIKPMEKDITLIANECINGLWGNGEERKYKLKAMGYDYETVQKEVNRIMHQKELEFVARSVINGAYGNGLERKIELEKDGYNYVEVQNIVNRMLQG